jgi:hypothetical protein
MRLRLREGDSVLVPSTDAYAVRGHSAGAEFLEVRMQEAFVAQADDGYCLRSKI